MSDIKISLIDLDGLAEPGKVLVEKVSEAVGGIFKPYQIERIAIAEANATIIKTKAEIEATELQHRALRRFLSEEALKQKNIESITRKTIPLLSDNAQPNNIEKDWLVDFFDKSRLISNEEIQDLWAQILAREATAPGTYSKRTILLMSTLDKNEAQLFMKLCAFSWNVNGLVPLIFDEHNEIYINNGISFNSLRHLDAIGLISFEPLAGYRRMKLGKNMVISYQNKKLTLELPNEKDNDFSLGKVMFTDAGLQLTNIFKPQEVDGFFEYVKAELLKTNIKSI